MSERKNGDFLLVFMVMILVIFGIIMVFSASYYYALNSEGDAFYYLKRDVIWASIGSVAMIIGSVFPYRYYSGWAPIILVISLVLLCLVLTPLGVDINGAKRWIGVGPITVMPGELAKPAVAIFVAWFLSRDPKRIRSFKEGVLPMFVLIGVYAGLILLQPNLSTAITVSAIIVSIMFAAGLKIWHLLATGALGISAIGLMIFLEPYRMRRFTSFLDPFADARDTGYQVVQSLLALGSGGLNGVGIGKSIQKTLYLPEPQSDFIFAIIGEELGFIGCVLVLVCFLILIWRGVHIALNSKDMFGMLLATGLISMIAIQVAINVAVATSSMPATGIALPFVGWGGNSLIIFMYCAGILLNISKNSTRY